jgi:hypothetical protein
VEVKLNPQILEANARFYGARKRLGHRNSLKIQFLEDSQGGDREPVPGWGKDRDKTLPKNLGHLFQAQTDITALFLRRSLFPEFRLLSCWLAVHMAPSMLVPAPEWFLKRGRSKQLLGSGAG